MLTQISNRNVFTTFREETIGGIEYIICNGVPLVEGVLNGRYVSAKEFGAFPSDWNDVPIVMRHPKKNGGVARVPFPDVPPVGRFYNAKLDGTRLTGEFWLDKNKLMSTDEGEVILMKIKSSHPIEISTGYFAESLPKTGKFNGLEYGLVDTNLHADHIALLPDDIGACSVKDGCGLNRNNGESSQDNCEPSQLREVLTWLANHYGPGDHKSGSSQDVHGGDGDKGGKAGNNFSDSSDPNVGYFLDRSEYIVRKGDNLIYEEDRGTFILSLTEEKKLSEFFKSSQGRDFDRTREYDITKDDWEKLSIRRVQNNQDLTPAVAEGFAALLVMVADSE